MSEFERINDENEGEKGTDQELSVSEDREHWFHSTPIKAYH